MLTFQRTKLFQIAITMIVGLPCIALSATPPSQKDDVVWHWFSKCSDGKLIKFEVIQDSNIIYTASFPICHVHQRDIMPEPEQRILSFFVESKKYKYFGAKNGTRLEGNIWEAGTDSDGIVLGVSFSTKNKTFLNSLFILDPDKPSEYEFAKGLVVKTFPVN
jgi:hypothetical protein